MASLQQHLVEAQRLFQAGQFGPACEAARAALKLRSDQPSALHVLGASQARLGQLTEARRNLRKALRAPNPPARVHFDLAYTYQLEGKFDRALEVLTRAVRDQPDDPFLLRATSEMLRMARRGDEAYALVRPAIDAGSAEPDVLIAFAVACARGGRAQDAVDLVEPRVAGATMQDRDRMHLMFSLGQCHEQLGEYDEAFACYARANELKGASYHPEAHAAVVDRVIAGWTPEAVAALPRPSVDTSRAVFVLGMPRSGTSLVEQILSMHPDVAAGGEINRFHRLLEPARDRQSIPSIYVHEPAVLDQAEVDRIAGAYMQVLASIDGRRRYVTDKVPLNVMRLGEIAAALPGAKVIHCVRRGIDTCLSCFTHDFGGSLPWAYDLAWLGAFHRDYERLAAHWKSVLDLPILEISYEALVGDPEAHTRAMLEFLELPWDEACLRHHESERLARTASMDQVRRPVYTSAIGRAERFGAALDPLRVALGESADRPIH